MLASMGASVTWWRLQSWAEAAWRNGVGSFKNILWDKDLSSIQPWQRKMPNSPEYDPLFTRAFVPTVESGCAQADAVVMQFIQEEGALDLFESIKIRFPHLPVLVEIDDNIMSVPTYNEAFDAYDPRAAARHRVLAQIKAADGVITTTAQLKEAYSPYNPNIWVVPNSIDFSRWKVKRKARPGVRIGWAGGSGREGDIEIVKDAILNICRKHKEVRFVFVNGPSKIGLPEFFKGHPQIEHKAVFVPILKYPALMASLDFDIGISPLVDSSFNRGKSNLKWLENAAMGIPTVASNVGHYAETIRHGKDGFLCDDSKEFERALDILITDRKRRNQMGRAAQERVRQDFNIDKNVGLYVQAIEEAKALKTKPDFAEAA